MWRERPRKKKRADAPKRSRSRWSASNMKTRSTPLPLRFPSDCAHHCPLDAPVHALIPGYSGEVKQRCPCNGFLQLFVASVSLLLLRCYSSSAHWRSALSRLWSCRTRSRNGRRGALDSPDVSADAPRAAWAKMSEEGRAFEPTALSFLICPEKTRSPVHRPMADPRRSACWLTVRWRQSFCDFS